MSFAALLGAAAVAVAALMIVGWLASLRRADASLVDSLWGSGFALIAALGLALGGGPPARRVLVFLLAATWGLRLSVHIHRRNSGQGEDYRYRAMRERHGAAFARRSLVTVFLLQGALMLVISLPLIAAATAASPERLTLFDLTGATLWLFGFLFEAIGDAQLARFKADPTNRGLVLDRGLWRYTRHPNYFGDAVLWWGFGVVALATPPGRWALAGPALMTFLLVRVSGVALLERGLTASKPGYRDYAARTSPFLPWPPKRAAR